MESIPKIFGSRVFNDEVMKQMLPNDIYFSLHKTITDGTELDITVANAVAAAMKDWATARGATHYTHWFQPLTGITAEKHEGFISPQSDGRIVLGFSGKELIMGEPDASSFPSGGLRATFEARGYTAWDPTSYAFIKGDSLCIPTVFCSYSGEVLDKKTPLLRSSQYLSDRAVELLRLLGDGDTTRVVTCVGAEQEYFLIDRELYNAREDLRFTNRTLFGAKPPKGQELDDHYFGAIRPRVIDYMTDLNEELWRLGVYAKTEHNEVAPSQHELAPVFTDANTACDHNQIMMEIMQRVAERHGLACILHEKPFACVNGSGKHNNWSLATDTGHNLLDPTKDPSSNLTFLLFLSAVIEAVDNYQDLIRLTIASAANDHRLGASEAPPAIVSIFLGTELTGILEALEKGEEWGGVGDSKMYTGVNVLPDFQKDTTDRNRTSPIAFTGNKFEFRMIGSSSSIADINTVINAIVARSLEGFIARLSGCEDVAREILAIIKDTYSAHKRIVFNGNNYSDEWAAEAKQRGLLNLKTTVDALPYLASEKNIELFEHGRILSRVEIQSRYAIMLENYCKVLSIEAQTMLDMGRRLIAPAALSYSFDLASGIELKSKAGIHDKSAKKLCASITGKTDTLFARIELLEAALAATEGIESDSERAVSFRDAVIPAMNALRSVADAIESETARSYWPFPTYSELLFSV